MLDVQPVLDKLDEIKSQLKAWYITVELILNYNGNGAVVVRDTLDERILVAVDFDYDDDLLAAADKLALKVKDISIS
jgi:hypothetical protein